MDNFIAKFKDALKAFEVKDCDNNFNKKLFLTKPLLLVSEIALL